MAIDPSISLDVNQPQSLLSQVGDMSKVVANIQSVKNMQAALPGIQADSAIKQRAASFNQWLTDNASKYITPDVDDNGKPKQNGNHDIDYTGLIKGAAEDGYVTEAMGLAAKNLANKSTEAQIGQTAALTAQTEQQTVGLGIANDANALKLGVDTRSNVANLMQAFMKNNGIDPRNITTEQQNLLDNQYNLVIKGINDNMAKKQDGSPVISVEGIYGPPDAPKDEKSPLGYYNFKPLLNEAYRTAGMSPEVQANLAALHVGPEYSDISSPVTKAVQQLAIANTQNEAQKSAFAKLTGEQLLNIPWVSTMWNNNQNPPNAKTTANDNMAQLLAQGNANDIAASAYQRYHQIVGNDSGLTQGNWASYFNSKIATITGGPARNALLQANQAITNAIKAQPDLHLESADPESLAGILRNQRDYLYGQAGKQHAIATSGTISGASDAITKAPIEPTKANPAQTTGSTKIEDLRVEAKAAIKAGKDPVAVAAKFKKMTGQELGI